MEAPASALSFPRGVRTCARLLERDGYAVLTASRRAGAADRGMQLDPDGPAGAETPPGLSFSVAGTRFAVGDTVRVTLGNGSQQALGYNLCSSALERREGEGWIAVQKLPDGAICGAELDVLRPGASAVGLQPVYSFLRSGTYRFRARVEWPLDDGDATLTSNAFRVLAD